MPAPGPRLLRSLRHRNFRLFFAGQGVSLVGTWLTRFAIGLEAFQLSHSTFKLGVVAFFSQAPTAVIMPVAGVLADRWNRRRALVVTQVAAMLQSAALAAFALSGLMTVWLLAALGAVQAVINAFDMPIRQSFVRQMVDDRADLPNAIALNSSLVNTARILGPVIASGLVALVGIGWCYTIDAATYLFVIGSLLAMRVAPRPTRAVARPVAEELREGFAYVRDLPLLRSLLLLFLITGTLGGGYAAMLPAFAEGTLHGGPHTLGAMMGASGAGALVGALYLANRAHDDGVVHSLSTLIVRCAFAVGIGLVALELASNAWMALPMLFVVGLGLIVQWAATNTIAQTVAEDDKLGRVISLYGVVFFAGAPLGALLQGVMSSALGPRHAFALAGAGCLAGVFLLGREVLALSARSTSAPPATR